jgi:hypothetical protein
MQKALDLLAIIMMVTIIPCAYAGTPAEDFENDALVLRATMDVEAMSREELDVFIDYLASCHSSLKEDSVNDYFCRKAREVYLIKYDRTRALDRVIWLLELMAKGITVKEKITKAGTQEQRNLTLMIFRLADIEKKLRDAANRASQKKNR